MILTQVIYHLIEAIAHKYVIKDSKGNWANKYWHIAFAVLAVYVHSSYALITGEYWLILTGLSLRWVIFTEYLNLIRGMPLLHTGKHFPDNIIKGRTGFVVRWATLIGSLLGYLGVYSEHGHQLFSQLLG